MKSNMHSSPGLFMRVSERQEGTHERSDEREVQLWGSSS
jgi:hypothetical protein